MHKRIIAKGNTHRNDHLRALLSDTFPGDVPIIVSNDGFYKNRVAAVRAFESAPWFVNWEKTDLLSMIRKKELSAVY